MSQPRRETAAVGPRDDAEASVDSCAQADSGGTGIALFTLVLFGMFMVVAFAVHKWDGGNAGRVQVEAPPAWWSVYATAASESSCTEQAGVFVRLVEQRRQKLPAISPRQVELLGDLVDHCGDEYQAQVANTLHPFLADE